MFIEKHGSIERGTKWKMKLTLLETNSSSLTIEFYRRKLVFQPSIFRGYVSFREGIVKLQTQRDP